MMACLKGRSQVRGKGATECRKRPDIHARCDSPAPECRAKVLTSSCCRCCPDGEVAAEARGRARPHEWRPMDRPDGCGMWGQVRAHKQEAAEANQWQPGAHVELGPVVCVPAAPRW